MGISLGNLTQGIRDLITEQSEAAVGFSIPMIAGMVPTIAEAFARVIANDPNKSHLIFPASPLENTITGGFCDLTANLTDDRLILDFWEQWRITVVADSTIPPFHMVRERGQLSLKRPTDTMYVAAAVEGQNLYTRNTDGALDADIGNIYIVGPCIPLIAEDDADTTLAPSLEGDMTQFGARFILGNVASHGKK